MEIDFIRYRDRPADPYAERLGEPNLPQWSIGQFTVQVNGNGPHRYVKAETLKLLNLKEELEHWKTVVRAHETQYRRPFVIPALPPPPVVAPPRRLLPTQELSNAQDQSNTFASTLDSTQIRMVSHPTTFMLSTCLIPYTTVAKANVDTRPSSRLHSIRRPSFGRFLRLFDGIHATRPRSRPCPRTRRTT